MSCNVFLVGMGTLSAAGADAAERRDFYRRAQPGVAWRTHGGRATAVVPLAPSAEARVAALVAGSPRYADLDRTVQMAVIAARDAAAQAGWHAGDGPIGVTLGSSRGATGLWERYHREVIETGRTAVLASPTTTLGNIASWVAQDAALDGPAAEISSTCSTSLYALGLGLAWLRAGMGRRHLVGGAEAPLTDFTLAQMKALRIYSSDTEGAYPSRPCAANVGRRNSMMLGEGAAVIAMETLDESELAARVSAATSPSCGLPRRYPLARLLGAGFALESTATNTSLSREGEALRTAMRRALDDADRPTVDLVVTHTPGTALGDSAELAALRTVFGEDERRPQLTSNKWLLGHTLGASGALSLELALGALQGERPPAYPWPVAFAQAAERPVRVAMVNSVGFGGNAASVLLAAVGHPA